MVGDEILAKRLMEVVRTLARVFQATDVLKTGFTEFGLVYSDLQDASMHAHACTQENETVHVTDFFGLLQAMREFSLSGLSLMTHIQTEYLNRTTLGEDKFVRED